MTPAVTGRTPLTFLFSADWIDVANNLLRQCHTNPRVRKLTDCDADVFIALYENILGEKVPDYIAAAGSQEDDIHNVQSVIDSLSLDYLQISLSHITGENVIRGDKDSIKNLLEIFDGLLEYLKEEMIEESQNGGSHHSPFLFFSVFFVTISDYSMKVSANCCFHNIEKGFLTRRYDQR
uniref:DUF5745 domain-containing protein n=1 Tax=Takifugu rubripes TaxID=31033 RepID=A0A674P1J8_TAKRU